MWRRPNIAEAENFPEAPQYKCPKGKYTQKPRAMQTNLFDLHCRGATGYVAKSNISEAESFPEALQDMWPQAKYLRSRELSRGATGYVAAGQISQKPRTFPRRYRICGEAKYRRIMEQKHEGREGEVPKGPRPEEAKPTTNRMEYQIYLDIPEVRRRKTCQG